MSVLTERETRHLEWLKDLDFNEFDSYLTQLMRTCEVKKTEMRTLRKGLRSNKKEASDVKKRGNFNKAAWTSVNCLLLSGGAIALFVPGLGWGALAIGFAGSIGTLIGSKVSEKSNKKKTDAIIESVLNKSGNAISVAEMANQKKQHFETARAGLINGGLSEEQANVIIILAMIEESFQRNARLPVHDGNREGNRLGQIVTVGTATFEVLTNNEVTAAAATLATENQKNIAEWLFKGAKYIASEIPAHVIKKACVAFAAVAVTVNIYQLVKSCVKDSEAMVLIEEIDEMLEEGEHSLQFFINLLHCLKEGIQRQINGRDKEECNRKIAALIQQMANYTTTIDDLQSKMASQTTMIEELRNELKLQTQSQNELKLQILNQNKVIYSIAYSLQNGLRLPAPEESFDLNSLTDTSLRNSIE